MPKPNPIFWAPLAILAGCASQPPGITASIAEPAAVSVAAAPGSAGYALSAKELELSCKELTGRMQLRILEIRDYHARAQASATSRVLQSSVGSIFGGTTAGSDPAGAYAHDRERLEAYNRRLAAMNCKTYNLDDELRPKDVKVTPTPVNPPANPKVAQP